MDKRKEALIDLLDYSLEYDGDGNSYVSDIVEDSGYGEHCYTMGDKEYLVLTNEEADIEIYDYVYSHIWLFNPYFLSAVTNFSQVVFENLSQMGESGNEAVRALVGDKFDYLVEEAILADGRGHYLASYDGKELESGEYFIYRIN